MPYAADQIGPIERRPINRKTRDRLALILMQHGRARGHDVSQISVLTPTDLRKGRVRTLRMLAAGVHLDDIRCAHIPIEHVGPGAPDGLPLRSAYYPLWWTVDDDAALIKGEVSIQDYVVAKLAILDPQGLASE